MNVDFCSFAPKHKLCPMHKIVSLIVSLIYADEEIDSMKISLF